MKKTLNQLLTLLAICCLGQSSIAQDDSAYLDLGRTKLRKDLTQHVTIKASDLEHMPFASLSDAIQPWLQGTFSNTFNMVYVIDGNLVNDVDAWSIYDIDEITLVQNALIQVNGSLKNQLLVLVKTRRKETEKQGFSVAGSSFLVNRNPDDYPGFEKESNFYHQYRISAWQNRNTFQYGLSANFLRDVSPAMHDGSVKIYTPMQANRFRLNGWMEWKLAEGHILSAQLNYTPQTIKEGYFTPGQPAGNYDYTNRQNLWNPSIRLTDRIAKGVTSELNASFVTTRTPFSTFFDDNAGQDQTTNGKQKVSNLLVRERINYKTNLGSWQLEPSVSFSARISDQTTGFTYMTRVNNTVINMFQFQMKLKSEVYMLTPAIAVSKGNSFYFQAGITTNLGKANHPAGEGVFPFASLSVDLLRLTQPDNPSSLQLFASYTRAGIFEDYFYTQGDAQYAPGIFAPLSVTTIPPGAVISQPYPQDPELAGLQAGIRFSSPGGRVVVDYNYDNRKYNEQLYIPTPAGTGFDYMGIWPEFIYSGHRIGMNAGITGEGNFEWRTGINATAAKFKAEGLKLSDPGLYYAYGNNGKTLITGGWVNRFRYKNFSAGLDILYLFNEQRRISFMTAESIDSWRINNVYAAYHFSIAHNKPLEVYFSSRNCFENDKSTLPDNRRFYGGGFRLQL